MAGNSLKSQWATLVLIRNYVPKKHIKKTMHVHTVSITVKIRSASQQSIVARHLHTYNIHTQKTNVHKMTILMKLISQYTCQTHKQN
jgi:hypothetical protein